MNRTDRAAESTSASKAPLLDVDKLIGQYVKLRDRKREMEARHKDELRPYTTIMGEIEAQLMKHMQDAGIDSVATPSGTAYQSTTPRATIQDRGAFRQFVEETGMFELVDWKANPRAVFEFIEAVGNGSPPPGVNASTFTAVRFRSPGEKE